MKFEHYDGQESIEISPDMTIDAVLEKLDKVLQPFGVTLVDYHDERSDAVHIGVTYKWPKGHEGYIKNQTAVEEEWVPANFENNLENTLILEQGPVLRDKLQE